MKILITGGLGNLGSWLTNYFLEEHSVTVIARREKNVISHPNYQFLQADITNLSQLNEAIDCYYDVCIHTASYNEHFHADYTEKSLTINSLGTEFLCQSLSRHGVGQLIYFSTFHVYGCSKGDVDETTAIEPVNDYGLTHFFAEKYIEKHHRNSGMNYAILRLSNSYGCPTFLDSDKWYLALNDLCRQAINNQRIELKSNGLVVRDFIWMGDVTQVIDKIIHLPEPLNDVFNLCFGESYSLNQIVERVQLAYYKEFNRLIDVSRNTGDTTKPDSLTVKNSKLSVFIQHEYSDRIESEARKIFKLLA
ncbi:NAD-dependent epimerase/dehydratase family protein [Vibrio hepatarius]|uniref:NAD-dependent epimerase/dehydratase family protein n=1 Tax=Vibrio hepatarius TaxID=171383 RepID=UPI00148DD05F|nr:SDR family oxidoreductase [Vibrio hepatarius]NOI15145.1 SDR family oxidoreductase [Vibrio hepatarius]